jgi:hypothetical protein
MSGGPFLHHPFRPKLAGARVRTASSVCKDLNSKVQRDPSTLLDEPRMDGTSERAHGPRRRKHARRWCKKAPRLSKIHAPISVQEHWPTIHGLNSVLERPTCSHRRGGRMRMVDR